jgi:hypothetical protein
MDQVIEKLYKEFSVYKRPAHFTDYKHCDECEEHDETMRRATLETLCSEHLGCIGYAPFSFLTEEGFAHYLLRIIELAAIGELNKFGEPFVLQVALQLCPTNNYDRFSRYTKSQCKAVYDALCHTNATQYEALSEYCYISDMENAIEYWKNRST